MSRSHEYREKLKGLRNWVPFLLRESGLPGPRGNLELLQAVADEGAAAAGLCEPRLLEDERDARAVLGILEELTHSLENEPDRRNEDVRTLRQALGHCWSVAIVASPVEGKKRFERLAARDDPDLRWVIRENLKKGRLEKVTKRIEESRSILPGSSEASSEGP